MKRVPIWFVRSLYRIHRLLGLLSAAFLFVVCLSGSLLLFRDDLDCMLHPYRLVPVEQHLQPIAELIENVIAAYPNELPAGLTLYPDHPDRAVAIFLGAPKYRQIYINPYNGRITGERQSVAALDTLRRLHTRLLAPSPSGRIAVGVIGLLMCVSVVSGALLFVPFRKGTQGFAIRDGKSLRISDLHKLTGIVTLAFHLMIASTGAVLGLIAFAPVKGAAPRPGGPANVFAAISPDEVLKRIPDADFTPTGMLFPNAKSFRYVVYGNRRSSLARDSASFYVFPADGSPLSQTYSPKGEALPLLEGLHFGQFAGLAGKISYLLLGLSGCALAITGPWIAWRKRRA